MLQNMQAGVIMNFTRLWHWKRRLSWPVGQWKSEGMLSRIVKVEKKVRKSVVKIKKKTLLGRLELFEKGKNRLLFGRLWNAVIKWKWSTATKVRSYSDNGTLSPLVHCRCRCRCRCDEPLRTEHNFTTFSVWKYFW